jgi:hypothetical protein
LHSTLFLLGIKILKIIAKGDKVWVRIKFIGIHTEEWDHFSVQFLPSGKKSIMKKIVTGI